MSSQVGTLRARLPEVTTVSYDGTQEDGTSASEVVDANARPLMGVCDSADTSGVLLMDSRSGLERFYSDLLYELGEFARRPSATAIGAAVVVKRVAKAHGVEVAERLPLPRFTRAERQERSSERWRVEQ
jgi:hypothetical protein